VEVKAIITEEKLTTIIIMRMMVPLLVKMTTNHSTMRTMKRAKMASLSTKITMKMMEMVASQSLSV
jgi:hypothetical protein